jgi:DNA-binding XRE family transcriptional regulator
MSFLHIHFSEIDTQIAQFARAIALPIRVFILRMIAENGNSLNRQALYTSAFTSETINKHILQLKSLGIIKIKTVKTQITYHIDEKLFEQMSTSFSALFDNINITATTSSNSLQNDLLLPAPTALAPENFGEYIKGHRMELNLSQANLAGKLAIDRTLLSRIENGKKEYRADKLNLLAKALYINADELKTVFSAYQDNINLKNICDI